MKKIAIVLSFLSASLLAGCADPYSGTVYRADQAKQVQTVNYGTITKIRPVTIDGNSGIGVGTIGGGTGQYLGAAAGAIGGGLLGNAVENRATRKSGIEIEVKLENGQRVSVVQSADEAFSVGQKVRIVGSGSSARVTR